MPSQGRFTPGPITMAPPKPYEDDIWGHAAIASAGNHPARKALTKLMWLAAGASIFGNEGLDQDALMEAFGNWEQTLPAGAVDISKIVRSHLSEKCARANA